MKPRMRPCRDGFWFCIGGGAMAFAKSAEAAYAGWKHQRDMIEDWLLIGYARCNP